MRFEKLRICKMHQKKGEEEVEIIQIPAPPAPIPFEWQAFSGEIEAARSIKPSKSAVDALCRNLEIRLAKEKMRQTIIQEYLQETAWRRWIVRGLTAAAMFALVITCELQREEIDSLTARVQTMEKRMADSLPISPRLTQCRQAVQDAMRNLAS